VLTSVSRGVGRRYGVQRCAQEAQLLGILAKELTQALAKVGTGKGSAPFPAVDGIAVGPNAAGDVLLGPAA